mmetsp:Transcript_2981/g.12884  ORF Transcript_2981/g.12884 Transcript_2981/m.12884 type:complete len:295 (-) Transcript_2981:29-913(-)
MPGGSAEGADLRGAGATVHPARSRAVSDARARSRSRSLSSFVRSRLALSDASNASSSSSSSSSTRACTVYTVLTSTSASSSSCPTCTATRTTVSPLASGVLAVALTSDGAASRTSKAPPGLGLCVTSRRARAFPTVTSASGSHASAWTPRNAAGAWGDALASPGALLGANAFGAIERTYSSVSGWKGGSRTPTSKSSAARYRVASASSTSGVAHAILRGSTGENPRAPRASSPDVLFSSPSPHRAPPAPSRSGCTSSGAAARVKTFARSITRTARAPPRDLRPIPALRSSRRPL